MGKILNDKNEISIKKILKWKKKYKFNLLEYQKDIRKYIENSHLVILPSYSEGTPHILLEAASMNRPLIASNIPGNNDIVEDGINGFLFQNKNSRDLIKKIQKFLILSDAKKTLMAKLSRELVINKFNENLVINKYLTEINLIND